ncbi:Adaptive-response sensory-kinase SasA [Candidatus Magnetaquicoccaceae bacterium FCR-1]|uniref:histidine kinase n=1 Tax=Candidatus Magnetaquiglobus chichijimensis TaxID=3141448 RepID=A0ABQ0CBD4_9PROT
MFTIVRDIENYLDIIRKIGESDLEDSVIDILLNLSYLYGYNGSRYYDIIKDPVSEKFICVLRKSSNAFLSDKIGYIIYDPTFSGADKIVSSDAQNEKGKKWIVDLKLDNSKWIDIPIFSHGEPIALLAMEIDIINSFSIKSMNEIDLIRRIASLKIIELRLGYLNELTKKMILQFSSIENDNDDLKLICELCNAQYIALFKSNLSTETLEKEKCYPENNGDYFLEKYDAGENLTGTAWVKESLRYIPDYSLLKNRMPNLICKGAQQSICKLINCEIKSVIYIKINLSGMYSYFLRVINRSDNPKLVFTKFHLDILERVAGLFGQAQARKDINSIIQSTLYSFSNLFDIIKDGEINYHSVIKNIKDSGFDNVAMLYCDENRVLDVYPSGLLRLLRNNQASRVLDFEMFKGDYGFVAANDPKIKSGGLLERIFPKYSLFYFVRLVDSGSRRMPSEILYIVFGVSVSDDSTVANQIKHWHTEHSTLIIFMRLFANILGLGRAFHRKKEFVSLAEEAIGGIGHELRSPIGALLNTIVSYLNRLRLENKHQNISAINYTQDEIEKYSSIISKIIDNALRWASMGGKVIEVDYETANIYDLIVDSVNDFKTELKNLGWLRIDINKPKKDIKEFPFDVVLIRSAFVNLIDNAIKYSHRREKEGELSKGYESVVTIGFVDQVNLVDVKISNWGLGIHQNDIENIFQSFSRSGYRDHKHTVRGVGLGLATCKKIIEVLHEGNISIESVPTLQDPLKIKKMEGFQTIVTVRLFKTLQPGRRDIIISER